MNPPEMPPLPLGQPMAAIAEQPKPPATDPPKSLDDGVDDWLASHPEGQDFDPQAKPPDDASPDAKPPAVGQQPKADAPPKTDDQRKSDASQPPPKTVEPPKDQQPPPQVKDQQPPPTEQPKPPAKAEPIQFSLDAKYKFNEGDPEWTGQQVIDALRERQQLLPAAEEVNAFRQTFGMDGRKAVEVWGPNITWMRQNPQAVEMLGQMVQSPHLTDYLLNCARYWDSPEGKTVRAQNPKYADSLKSPTEQRPQMSPEVEQRFAALEAQNAQLRQAEADRMKRTMLDRVAREMNVAFERYPFLRENKEMRDALLMRAQWINGGDDSPTGKGILDALEMEKPLYDAHLIVYNQTKNAADGASPPPQPPTPPPLMGSAGASPQGTQSARYAQPKRFSDLDDAVDDWINNPPANFR